MAIDPISGALAGLQLINTVAQGDDSQRQQNFTLELMQKQSEYNKEAMQLQKEAQLDLFNKTGYEARTEQLKKAGLNPGLIYGIGAGGGGGVTGNISAPQVSQGSAPNVAATTANKTAQIGMALQLSKLESEIEVNKSVAEVNRANVPKLGQETLTESVKRASIELENDLKSINVATAKETQNYNIETIKSLAEQAAQKAIAYKGEAEKALNEGKMSTDAYNAELMTRINNMKESAANILVAQSKNQLQIQEAKKLVNDIYVEKTKVGQEYQKLGNEYILRMLEMNTSLDRAQMEQTSTVMGTIMTAISTLMGASIIKGSVKHK